MLPSPKSISLTFPSESTRMFSGLTSLWTIPAAWRYSIAERICQKYLQATSSVHRDSMFRYLPSVPFEQYSSTMKK